MGDGNERQWVKPFAQGFALGLIAAPVIAFSAGWITTTGASALAVEAARVQTLAGICTSTAGRIATASNTDLATIKGFDNRAKRDELVAAALADIQVPDDLVGQVTADCSRTFS
ncbi:hypothetical protein BLJAPNOD_06142 [Ensifer sp. M14]|uniref:hypothetical protein n=1 Tax=Ensifer sp. M14 TaxID=2203782 RepID=UPI000E1C64E6|nr:hypothetical protein [Ensifer sp. M14]RDL47302.1 hypothetical protein BLJAPNOD_06142 [Ensifer sp. M14]